MDHAHISICDTGNWNHTEAIRIAISYTLNDGTMAIDTSSYYSPRGLVRALIMWSEIPDLFIISID